MSRNPSKRAATVRSGSPSAAREVRRLPPPKSFTAVAQMLVLAAIAGLEVLVPLVPSEAAPRGTGVLFALCWLLVLLLGLVLLLRERIALRVDFASALTLVLGGWLLASGAVRAWEGNPRATWNATWQWVALIASYWSLRYLVREATSRRALCAVMISLATALAAHGIYQFAVGMPLQQKRYQRASEEEKQSVLRANGIDPSPKSPARIQFENRLASTEPFATFGLANSLAGVLAPWLVLATGLLALGATRRTLSGWQRGLLAMAILLLLMCLVLTKSRAAWLGCAAGGGVVLLALVRTGGRTALMRGLWGLVAIAVAVLAGIASGALDRQVLTQAGLSLAYRLQYWRAALAMVARHPVFGCGPGNFQDYYTRYKLPWASETVADPHNLVFEAAANGGLVAGVAVLALLVVVPWMLVRRQDFSADTASFPGDSVNSGELPVPRDDRLVIYMGGSIALLVSIAAGLYAGFPPELVVGIDLPVVWLLGLPLFVLTLVALDPWIRGGTIPRELLLAAWIALGVNLLAAGGISFAGVAQSFWLIAAVGVGEYSAARSGGAAAGRRNWTLKIAFVVVVGLAFGCWLSSVRPTQQADHWLRQAERARDYEEAARFYILAAEADPWDPRPWQWLAEIYQLHWLEERDASLRGEFEAALAEAERRDSQAFAFAMRRGWLFLRAYRATGEADALEASLEAYRRACALYPNSNFAHAQWAWVLAVAGQTQASRAEAERALELDERNPHIEQKLKQRVLEDPAPELDSATYGRPPLEGSAEQVMRQLRTAKDSAS